MTRRRALTALALCLALSLAPGCGSRDATGNGSGVAQVPAPRADERRTVLVGGAALRVLTASTRAEQERGLRGIELGADEGMLFSWERPALPTFVMGGVTYPLDVIWVGPDLRVSGVSRLVPGETESAIPPGPVRHVLETRLGWAGRNGVRRGTLLRLDPEPVEGTQP